MPERPSPLAPPVECRQWWAAGGGKFTLVVAATKEDAKIIARSRFLDASRFGQGEWGGIHVRPATTHDIGVFEQNMATVLEVQRRTSSAT